ncbi:prepilin peptidase [Candidatus Kaiserbacteria bacterium]|nr:prepilin peptidase [Candidatus Kaiserbacteria bacterium]
MDILFVALFGLIIGSFLNVFICRLHTGKSLNGRSHCLSCGTVLVWYELLPALSYLVLGGRCRHCSSRISGRYFLVEVGTALLFVFSFLTAESVLDTALLFILSSVLVVIAVYDMMHTIIPDEMVLVLVAVAVLLVIPTGVPLAHLGAGVGAALFFWIFWYVSSGTWMGLGDAKLAFPLAGILGGWGAVSMVILSFWVGAIISLFLLALQKGKTHMPFLSPHLTMKSEIPFAPFLIIGFVCVYFFHVDIFTITDSVTQAVLGY